MRAKNRRDAINRAYAALRRATTRNTDAYPAALLLGQRAGVALEDLARLVLAFESADSVDSFDALRSGVISDCDAVFDRYYADAEGLRCVVRLPSPDTTGDLAEALREAVLAGSDALARRWHAHWVAAADGWQLLRRLAKGGRHGAPLIPRELIVQPPGAGALGTGLADRFERWALVIDSKVEHAATQISTEYGMADLTDRTLRRARQAALDAIAVTRDISNAHVHRVRSETTWAMPSFVLKLVTPAQTRILKAEAS